MKFNAKYNMKTIWERRTNYRGGQIKDKTGNVELNPNQYENYSTDNERK